MAYQFIHIETYSKKPKRVKGAPDQFNSIDQVLGEAARDGRWTGCIRSSFSTLCA